MAATSELLLLFVVTIVLNVMAVEDTRPPVGENWIYTMIAFGFFGMFVILAIILIAAYKTFCNWESISKMKLRKKKSKQFKQTQIILNILNFTLWTLNFIACFQWTFLRTSLFISLNASKCTAIYISNYLSYLIAKYCLHLLLLYRLYVAFRNSRAFMLNPTFAKIFALIITINFIVFTSLWMDICLSDVKVGITVPSHSLEICTLYNNSSDRKLSFYEKIWPILCGAQDFFVGIFTLAMFWYKINEFSRNRGKRSCDDNSRKTIVKTERLIRKLLILGAVSVFSTFIFFSFAVAFYGNLTFLLPFDAMINSLCMFLFLRGSNRYYYWVCCATDMCLQNLLKHSTQDTTHMTDISHISRTDMSSVNTSTVNNKRKESVIIQKNLELIQSMSLPNPKMGKREKYVPTLEAVSHSEPVSPELMTFKNTL
eukprot:92206_1